MNAPEKITSNGVQYIRADVFNEVCGRIYNLLKDQKEYFKTRDRSLMESCRKRENGFIKWYENGCGSARQANNQQSMQI